jgi:hypothetical protein
MRGWKLVLLAAAMGCDPEPRSSGGPLGTGVSRSITIGPDGGTLTLEGVTLTVPHGSLLAPVTITITSLTGAPPVASWASPLYRFEPSGLLLRATVRMEFTGNPLDPVIFWSNDTPDGTVSGQVVERTITHFSTGFVASRPQATSGPDAGPSGGPDAGPDAGASAQTRAIVAASDYMTPGRLFSIDLTTRAVSSVGQVGEDPVLRRYGGKLLLVNRFGATNADNVEPLDLVTLTGPQYSTGAGSNPHDIACLSLTKCYVAVNAAGTLPILDLTTGARTGGIDLSSFDPDGVPNAESAWIDGARLFVSIQRLDQTFTPRGIGQVVVIDTTTDTVAGSIDLATANPTGFFAVRPGTSQICTVTSGDFSGTQGGIECIDTQARARVGFLVRSDALGGYLGGFTLSADGGRGWAAVNKAFPTSELWEFDVRAGTPTRRIGGSSRITDVAIDDRGQLWAADTTMAAPGIRVYRSDSGVELTSAPIGLGMLPPAFAGGIVFAP